MAKEYVFLHEWDVDDPQEAVFTALADASTYPQWWKPVYIDVEGDCEPALGCTTEQRFKGKLPYTLRTTSEIVAFNPTNSLAVKVVGDLTGNGMWTLTPRGGGVHVRFDWTVFADRWFLKLLTPVARPLFRSNHDWSAERAIEGLEPYARAQAGLPAKG
jgi:hypothetical protein